MGKVHVSLVLGDDYLDRFSHIVQQCAAVGLEVESQLEATGIVTGVIDEAMLADLERVTGVAAVEPQRTFRLPPPDTDLY